MIDKNDIDVKVYRDDTEQIDSAVRLTHKATPSLLRRVRFWVSRFARLFY